MDADMITQVRRFNRTVTQRAGALSEEFLVRALLAQAPFVEDEDAVGVLNGAEAMRDD